MCPNVDGKIAAMEDTGCWLCNPAPLIMQHPRIMQRLPSSVPFVDIFQPDGTLLFNRKLNLLNVPVDARVVQVIANAAETG